MDSGPNDPLRNDPSTNDLPANDRPADDPAADDPAADDPAADDPAVGGPIKKSGRSAAIRFVRLAATGLATADRRGHAKRFVGCWSTCAGHWAC